MSIYVRKTDTGEVYGPFGNATQARFWYNLNQDWLGDCTTVMPIPVQWDKRLEGEAERLGLA